MSDIINDSYLLIRCLTCMFLLIFPASIITDAEIRAFCCRSCCQYGQHPTYSPNVGTQDYTVSFCMKIMITLSSVDLLIHELIAHLEKGQLYKCKYM